MLGLAKKTPLAGFHIRHGGKMVDFAGWSLPVQYSGVIREHLAVRRGAGMFDASHMGEIIISGARSVDFLNAVLTNDFTTLKPGAARYSVLCNPDGTCADDVIVFNLDGNSYMVVVNAVNTQKDAAIFSGSAPAFGVSVEDASDSFALLAVQGPLSEAAVSSVFGGGFSGLQRFGFKKAGDFIVSRTGYTGGDGFEIFCPPNCAEETAEKFVSASGVELCGLGARDSLRVEACLPLYGHEISESITPFEAGLGWTVKLSKKFVGFEPLQRQSALGPSRRVVWFKAEGRRIVRAGDPIFYEEKKAGEALSGTWSAMLDCPIGSALLDASVLLASEGGLCAKVRGTPINIELRGK